MKKLIVSMLSAVMLITSVNCTAFARSHQDSYFDFYVYPGIENHSDFRYKALMAYMKSKSNLLSDTITYSNWWY